MSSLHAEGIVRPDWARETVDSCADSADVALYLRRRYLPLRREADTLLVALADSSAENTCWIEARHGAVRFIAVESDELLEEISRRFRPKLTDEAIFSLCRARPDLSAQRVASRGQIAGLFATLLVVAYGLVEKPIFAIAIFVVSMTLLFVVGTSFRVVLAWLGGFPRADKPGVAGDDATLPVYSILVPLYREAEIVSDLLRALLALKYPRDKLDIKLVVEADDGETATVCNGLRAQHAFEVVRVPPSMPRTKPNSCVALLSAFAAEPLFLGFPGWMACPSGPFVPTAVVGT